MFSYWFQKFLYNFIFPVAVLGVLGVFAYAFYVQENIEPPGNIAPFAEMAVQSSDDPLRKETPVGQAHRTPREMQRWISETISDIMTFDKANYETHLRDVSKYFTAAGYAQFKKYLDEAQMKQVLDRQGLKASLFVELPPLLLNDGDVGGVYRWLYEVQATISYVPEDATEYKPGMEDMSRQIQIRLQVGRVSRDESPDEVKIESWAVSPRRR